MISQRDLDKEWYSTGDIARLIGKTTLTVQNYDKRGLLDLHVDQTGRYFASREELIRFLKNQGMFDDSTSNALYLRNQSNDVLDKLLRVYPEYSDLPYTIYRDEGSMDDNLPELNRLLDRVAHGDVEKVFIYDGDTFLSPGYFFLSQYLESHGVVVQNISKN